MQVTHKYQQRSLCSGCLPLHKGTGTPPDVAEGVQVVQYHLNRNTFIIRSSLSFPAHGCCTRVGPRHSSTSLLAPCTATPHPTPAPSSNICLRFLTDLLISKCKGGWRLPEQQPQIHRSLAQYLKLMCRLKRYVLASYFFHLNSESANNAGNAKYTT